MRGKISSSPSSFLYFANCHGATRQTRYLEWCCYVNRSALVIGNFLMAMMGHPSTSFRSVAMKGVNRAFAQKDHEIIIGEGREDGRSARPTDADADGRPRFHSFSPSSRDCATLVTLRPTCRGESSPTSLRYFTPSFSSWTSSLP